MGNRAVITTAENFENDGVGVYLHWNGGRDSVEAFLKYCELKGYRSPESDNYGWARLCMVVANYFTYGDCDDGLSLGVDKVSNLDCDNFDNGVYIIEDWKIVDRVYIRGPEQRNYDLQTILLAIDARQPVKLGAKVIEEAVREHMESEVEE